MTGSRKKSRERQLRRLAERRAAERRRARRRRILVGTVVVLFLLSSVGAGAFVVLRGGPETGEEERPMAGPTPTPSPDPIAEQVACDGEVPEGAGEEKPRFDRPPRMQLEEGASYRATIRTSCGPIVVDLFAEETPVTVNSFVFLAEQGFYDGLTFHRMVTDFVIQGGDPAGDGTGGPGYEFEDEIVDDLAFDRPGLLAMANSGPHTNGSQFFITLGEPDHLTGGHTIFGEVAEGMDVVQEINSLGTTEGTPQQTVYIERVRIESS